MWLKMMNEGNVEGDEVRCREREIQGWILFQRVLGSYWEVESRVMTSSDIISVHYRRIPLAAVRAREEAKRPVTALFNDPRRR